MLKLIRDWWRSIPARLNGTHVRDRSEHAMRLSNFAACDRAVEQRMRKLVDVRDFGAVGDGITDDAPSFRKAVLMLDDPPIAPRSVPDDLA